MNNRILDDDQPRLGEYPILEGFRLRTQLFAVEVAAFILLVLGFFIHQPTFVWIVATIYFLLPFVEFRVESDAKDFLGRFLILLFGCWGLSVLYLALFGGENVEQYRFRMLIAGVFLWSLGQLLYPYRYRKILQPEAKKLLLYSAIGMTISLPVLLYMNFLEAPYLRELSITRLTMIGMAKLFILAVNIYFLYEWWILLKKTWARNKALVYFLFRFLVLIIFNLMLIATKIYMLIQP